MLKTSTFLMAGEVAGGGADALAAGPPELAGAVVASGLGSTAAAPDEDVVDAGSCFSLAQPASTAASAQAAIGKLRIGADLAHRRRFVEFAAVRFLYPPSR